MQSLTSSQYSLIYEAFSFMIGVMGITVLLLFIIKDAVSQRYQPFIALRVMIVALSGYDYYRLLDSWTRSFSIDGQTVISTGHIFDDSIRFSDWIITVPLLLISLVVVLDLPPRQAWSRSLILGIQAVEMIALGYPGQTSSDPATRWLWFGLGMIPFMIIIYQLYFAMAQAIEDQPVAVRGLVKWARTVLLVSWSLYPAIYLLPLVGLRGTSAFVGSQIGYAVADLLAKPIFGVLLLIVAMRKSAMGTLDTTGTPMLQAGRA